MSVFDYRPTVEDRIRQIVRVEEPVTVYEIARLCRGDFSISEIDRIVWEMTRNGLLKRVWEDDLYADVKFELR